MTSSGHPPPGSKAYPYPSNSHQNIHTTMDKILHQGYQWRRGLVNRTNATARDNLMTGASLGYSGNYFSTDSLNYVGERSYQLSSTIAGTGSSDMLRLDYGDAGLIHLQSPNAKYIGRPVRYHTTQSMSTIFPIITVCLKI